jgi:hypothetical protein
LEVTPVKRLGNPLSTFSHAADRGTAVAYFLGAVVPLVALGIVTERYVLAPIVEPSAPSGPSEPAGSSHCSDRSPSCR